MSGASDAKDHSARYRPGRDRGEAACWAAREIALRRQKCRSFAEIQKNSCDQCKVIREVNAGDKATIKIDGHIFAAGREHFIHWSRVDFERTAQDVISSSIFAKVSSVEEVTRMLATERCDDDTYVEVGE